MVTRVKNEVEIHSRLKHPSVLELYNYFEDTNYVYLVLEMCHNRELNRYLKTTQKGLTETEGKMKCVGGRRERERERDREREKEIDKTFHSSYLARRIFRQAVQGLLYLHSHNILHRDLSLSNLLLTTTMDAVSNTQS